MLARSCVACRALMPWPVIVATAPPTCANEMWALAAMGSTAARELARSCIVILPAPTAATIWLVNDVAWPAFMP
jgi:hypothetical protein